MPPGVGRRSYVLYVCYVQRFTYGVVGQGWQPTCVEIDTAGKKEGSMNKMRKVAKAVTISNATIGVGLLAVGYALLKGQVITAAFGLLVVVLGVLGRWKK